jgi:hypothetical protein
MNQPAEPGHTAFEQRLTRHADFASATAIGGRALDFVDARSAGHARVARSGLVGGFSTGARQLAVELGLRYLPLAAAAEFRPSVTALDATALYPADWRQWLDVELLRLFEEEEDALFLDVSARAPALATAPARVAAAMARRPEARAAAQSRKPAPAVARRAQHLRRLAAAAEQAAPGLSHSLRDHARSRSLALAPSELAERVWISAEAESLPATARALMQASAPSPASAAVRGAAATAARIAPTMLAAVARAVLPTVEPGGLEAPLPRAVGSRLSPLVATPTGIGRPGEVSRAAVARSTASSAAPAVSRLRSPYPGGVGRVAAFGGLIAARPALGGLVTGEAPAVRAATATSRVADAMEARGGVATVALADGRGAAARGDRVQAPLWLDEIGVDRSALPGLSASLDRYVSQMERGARSASLLLGAERPVMRTVDDLERRALGRSGRADLFGSHGATGSGEVSPLRIRDRSLAETVLLSIPDVARESAVAEGIGRRDANPAAALSDTRLGLAARSASAAGAGQSARRLSLAQVAPATLDARPTTSVGVTPTVAAVPAPERGGASGGAVPAARTWQLFGPAKALSLSLLLSEQGGAGGAVGAGGIAGTERLGLALTEGRRALADLVAEGGATPLAAARALGFAPSVAQPGAIAERALRHDDRGALPARIATAFGSVSIHGDGATVSAMRVGGLAERDLVQLVSERSDTSEPAVRSGTPAARLAATLPRLAPPVARPAPSSAVTARFAAGVVGGATSALGAGRGFTAPAASTAGGPAGLVRGAEGSRVGALLAAAPSLAASRFFTDGVARATLGTTEGSPARPVLGVAPAPLGAGRGADSGASALGAARATLGVAGAESPVTVALRRVAPGLVSSIRPALTLLGGVAGGSVSPASERREVGAAALEALLPTSVRSALRAEHTAVSERGGAGLWDLVSRGGLIGLASEERDAGTAGGGSASMRLAGSERVLLARVGGDESREAAPVRPIASTPDARWQAAVGRVVAATESVEATLRTLRGAPSVSATPFSGVRRVSERLPALQVAVSGLGELLARAGDGDIRGVAPLVSPALGAVAKRIEQLTRESGRAAVRPPLSATGPRPVAGGSADGQAGARVPGVRPAGGVLGHVATLAEASAARSADTGASAGEGGLQWASRLLSRVHEEARAATESLRSGGARRALAVPGAVREWVSLVDEVADRIPSAAAAEQRAILPMLVRARNAIHAAAEASMPLAAMRAAERSATRSGWAADGAAGDDRGAAPPMRLRTAEIERATVGLVDYHARLSAGGDEGLRRGPAAMPRAAVAPVVGSALSSVAASRPSASALVAGRPPVREAGATFGATAQRTLRATGGLFDPASGELRLVRPRRAGSEAGSGGVVEQGTSAAGVGRRELLSPLETAVSRLSRRVAGDPAVVAAPMRLTGAERGLVALPGEQVGAEEVAARLASAGLTVGGIARAVAAQPSGAASAGTAPSAGFPGEVASERAARPARGTLSALVARIFDEVPSAPIMRATPSNLVLSGLSFAPERIAMAAEAGHRAGVRGTRFEASVFGLRSEREETERASAARGPVGETVGLPSGAAPVEGRRVGGGAAAVSAAPATLGADRRGAPADGGTSAGAVPSQAWSGLLGLASALTQLDAGSDEGPGAAARPRSSSRLPWLERELTALVGAGGDVRWHGRSAPKVRAVAASAASSMLRLLDLDEAPSAEAPETFPGVPEAAAPGDLVAPTPGALASQTTRLGAGPRGARSMQLSAAEQAKREWVEPWAGSAAMQTAPHMEAGMPLAARSGGGGGGGGGGAGAQEAEHAAPAPEKLQDMAEEVFAIIRERLREEADRYGR